MVLIHSNLLNLLNGDIFSILFDWFLFVFANVMKINNRRQKLNYGHLNANEISPTPLAISVLEIVESYGKILYSIIEKENVIAPLGIEFG